jgi:signal transduction histidine kinase
VPFTIANIGTDSRCLAPDFAREHGLVSCLGVPLIAKDEPLGVMAFFTKEAHAFSEPEIELLNTLAGQSAIAIQNAQLYDQTKQQASALEKANKAKDEFLSVVSHELRTPLNVVLGYSQMLKERMFGDIVPEQEKALGTILARTRDQLAMVNSILRVTQIEAGASSVDREETSLSEFLDEIRSAYALPLEKEVSIEWEYSPELPVIEIDRDKLKHVLENLISNAIKFTDEGSVIISARHIPEQEVIRFMVADGGVGIPKEKIPFIFEMFRQLDSSVTRKHEGMGIGLYIAKKFTELLGGFIDVESEPGRGSIFTVTIHFSKCPENRVIHEQRARNLAYEI